MMAGYPGVAAEGMVQRVFWVHWFHHTPHINLTLQFVNSTFDPSSPVYQESLGIIASVPAALLILTLLVLLLYLLTRCCDNRPRKSASITCLKVTLVLFGLITLGALGVSVWGNEEVHEGVNKTIYAIDNINSMVHSLTNQTEQFDETIRHNLQPQLNLFKETVQQQTSANESARMFILESLHFMQQNISDVLLINVEDINAKVEGAEMGNGVRLAGLIELGRWVGTLGITGILMMVVLLLLVGVAKHSRCTLIMFSVLGLLSMIVCWGLTSIYLVGAVGLSDWCLDPAPYLEESMTGMVSRDVASYYLHCDALHASPFRRYLRHAQKSADSILDNLTKVTRVADQNYDRQSIHPRLSHLAAFVSQSQRTLEGISALLECQSMHHQYLTALNATCYRTMSGVVYLLLSAAGSGLLFTMLVWFTSHTWIYINLKSESGNCEERDPFLPGGSGPGPGRGSRGGTLQSIGGGPGYSRPRHSHTPPQTPPFPGTL